MISVGKESRCVLPKCLWLKVSHKLEIIRSTKAIVLSRLTWGRTHSHVLLGFFVRIQFLRGCWTEGLGSWLAVIWMLPNSWPRGPLQQGVLLQQSSDKRGPGRENISKTEAAILYHRISEVTSITFAGR